MFLQAVNTQPRFGAIIKPIIPADEEPIDAADLFLLEEEGLPSPQEVVAETKRPVLLVLQADGNRFLATEEDIITTLQKVQTDPDNYICDLYDPIADEKMDYIPTDNISKRLTAAEKAEAGIVDAPINPDAELDEDDSAWLTDDVVSVDLDAFKRRLDTIA